MKIRETTLVIAETTVVYQLRPFLNAAIYFGISCFLLSQITSLRNFSLQIWRNHKWSNTRIYLETSLMNKWSPFWKQACKSAVSMRLRYTYIIYCHEPCFYFIFNKLQLKFHSERMLFVVAQKLMQDYLEGFALLPRPPT